MHAGGMLKVLGNEFITLFSYDDPLSPEAGRGGEGAWKYFTEVNKNNPPLLGGLQPWSLNFSFLNLSNKFFKQLDKSELAEMERRDSAIQYLLSMSAYGPFVTICLLYWMWESRYSGETNILAGPPLVSSPNCSEVLTILPFLLFQEATAIK